ncbi:MAG: response regulator [Proteobacteria bacterium]|nr:response regulator [Pseudomonadota bacterium]
MPSTSTATARRFAHAMASEPVKILLVDDQPGRLLTYRAILEPLGEQLIEASSGMEALKRLMDDEFALILLDVNMPGMDGFETASLIHQHPRFEKTPIIFVTAVNVTDMDRLRGYKLGAVDYVMVPVIPEVLRSKVEVLAELHRKRSELQSLNASLAADNQALQREKARELEALNQSLRVANDALAARNAELQVEITERSRAEQLLREADQRKNEFLATLAHELRNPLAPLQNALAIRRLEQGEPPGPLQSTMERQLSLLVRLIDDLLDIARITQNKLALRRESTSLEDVLRAAVEIARPLLDAGGHDFNLRLPDQPVALLADRMRLSQVFANLLNNAAKYSDPGGRIELAAELVGHDQVLVRISDTGIGLAPEQLDAVFGLFSQVDTTIERSRGGLGIGLTLVQKLAEMHGGRVEVHSAGLGQGCIFSVRLPVGAAAASAPLGLPAPAEAQASIGPDSKSRSDWADNGTMAEPPTDAAAPASPARVLVVDDNRDAADTLAMMIRLLGHEVTQIYDPLAVEGEIERFAPDLLFLDVGMPGRSGYDIASSLRQRADGNALEIIAVTGWGQPEDRRRTREAGFDEHLVKPPQFESIRRICSRGGRTRQPETDGA